MGIVYVSPDPAVPEPVPLASRAVVGEPARPLTAKAERKRRASLAVAVTPEDTAREAENAARANGTAEGYRQ